MNGVRIFGSQVLYWYGPSLVALQFAQLLAGFLAGTKRPGRSRS